VYKQCRLRPVLLSTAKDADADAEDVDEIEIQRQLVKNRTSSQEGRIKPPQNL
jgi:hypothetical protein